LKYYDNVGYEGSIGSVEEEISNVQMNRTSDKHVFQKIETINSINRFKHNTGHKSNLYSIKINNLDIMNETDENVNKIKTDIKNNIRKLCKYVTPVNT
jgi:hypothetical protein